MVVRTVFEMNVVKYDYTLDTDRLDRNYEDEAYGYWIIPLEGESFLEINILKELANGTWIWSQRGYAAYYETTEQTGPTSCTQIDFTV